MSDLSNEGKWYVVHTYSGHENKVKTNIEKLVENRSMQHLIFAVKVPMEKYIDNKNGKQIEKERKKFPGYVLVNMLMTDESWYIIRNTKGVTGFVGPGSKPVPLSEREVRSLGVQSSSEKMDIEIGEVIIIKEGACEGLEGVVNEIDSDKEKVRAFVNMFGRDTVVELDFEQFEKIKE